MQLYAVFHGDGYECSDFVGVFETEEQAEECVKVIKAGVLAEWQHIYQDRPERLAEEPADIVDVKPIIVGQYALPHDYSKSSDSQD